MASSLPSSGTISFSQIENEFGQGNSRSMGDYRRPNEYGDMTLPIDDGVPTSGAISFSDFYGKELNMMVDCYSQQNDDRRDAQGVMNGQVLYYVVGTRIDAKDYFSKGRCHNVGVNLTKNVRSVGGGYGGGKKVIIHVNKVIQSDRSVLTSVCALRTGKNWDSGTRLRIEVGGKGIISGAGGDGGVGGSYGTGADGKWGDDMRGGKGNSGLGIEWNETEVTVMRSDTPYRKSSGTPGFIAAGLGGGGGGGGSKYSKLDEWCWSRWFGRCQFGGDTWYHFWGGGGGGGGGQGWPHGEGGIGGVSGEGSNGGNGMDGKQPLITASDNGGAIGVDDGTLTGSGGEGRTHTGKAGEAGTYSAIGGDGGDGGEWEGGVSEQDGETGQNAVSCNTGCGAGAAGGEDGSAIAQGLNTGWTYGTWNDGDRIFGEVTDLAPF